MGTYKVIQDIEAEDKLLGPLTLRQFIYAAIVAVSGFIAFRLGVVAWWLALPLLPHMILFGILAAPFGHDQSSEVWLLAKIRFFLKPHRRIWDQSGMQELVTITAPKKIERILTKNFSQTEVKSRLRALADTIDSRGWVIKSVDASTFMQPAYAMNPTSDRLIDAEAIPQEVPNYDTTIPDMLDETTSPTAQNLDQMISASTQNRRQQLLTRMQQGEGTPAQPPADYWFMNGTAGQPPATPAGYAAFDSAPLVTPGASGPALASVPVTGLSAQDEEELLARLRAEAERPDPTYNHLRVIQPLSEQNRYAPPPPPPSAPVAQNTPMKTASDPAILELASNDDLNVATIARQAHKMREEKADGEVIINLH